jgi:hypothetical protein
MRWAFPQYFNSSSRFLTYTVVARALRAAGHELTDDVTDCDVVGFSACDVMDYLDLVKLRGETGKPILVGGSYAFNYKSAILYSDMVWVGEVYEMAECMDIDALRAHPSCYVPGKPRVRASARIDWDQAPIAQIAPKKCYYWGGVGCKNKCKFCFTSWTHAHQVNSKSRIDAAKRIAAKEKKHLMITSNEYEDGGGGRTMDMLLADYIARPVSASMVRCGIEFATEGSRREMGKRISDDDIFKAIQKMSIDNVAMRWFHIAGYDPLADWDRYIEMLCGMLDRYPNSRIIHLMFNNLQYQNYTPLYARRREIDPARYIDITVTRRWYDRLRQYSRHVLIGAPSPFQHVACRMGVELSTERGQIDYWLSKLKNAKGKLTIDEAYRALFATGVLDTPMLRLNMRTGEITEGEHGA